jgi:tetratricopeptide (TPR) repeat protein
MDDYEKWIPVLYQQKDFSAIENRVTDLLKDRSDEAEAYQLYTLYRTLGDVHGSRDIELKENILNEWCSQQPESHIPWLLRGIFYTGYAWQIRGGGWAKEVPKDAWAKFEAMLERAQADLEKSYRLNTKDPNSSCQLLIVAKGLGLSRDEMEKYFQNAIAASPFHYGSHYQKLNYLMPKWHGTQQELDNFAKECMELSNEHPYMGLVTIGALEESHYRSPQNVNYLGRDDVWPTVEKLYENYFTRYPEDIRRRFSYAYHAYLAQKYDVAIKQFEVIGDRWMEGTLWNSLNHYNGSRAYTYAAYAYMRLPPGEAMVVLKKAIDLDPFQKSSYFKLGTTAIKLGQYDEAEAAYSKVLEIDPNSTEAHLLLCQVYEKTNNPAQAKYHAEKALRCNPTDQQKKTAKNYIDASNKGLK